MIGVSVLGSTGSIGQSTLDVISKHPDKFFVVGLAANRNVDMLFHQCQQFKPAVVAMHDETAAHALQGKLCSIGHATEVLSGAEGVVEVASLPESKQVMAAIVGAAGLESALAAAELGKRVLLANKEALVMAGQLFMDAVTQSGAELLPIDSEHNAIFQSLPRGNIRGFDKTGVEKILLTASGGPFLGKTRDKLKNVTPEQAIAHPNWEMGKKISIDSATLFNKGLELIEACWLFDVTPDCIEVVIHKQSIIHSMVSYVDGSVMAQMGNPDMRTPIAYGMAFPDRIASGVKSLDLSDIARFDFKKPDRKTFPALNLAAEAFNAGGNSSVVLNAANEIAVEAFLKQKIGFLQIAEVVDNALQSIESHNVSELEELWVADAAARRVAHDFVVRV